MSGSNEDLRTEPIGDSGKPQPSALQSAQSYVAASPGTSCPGCVGCKAFSFAFGALIEWAQTHALTRDENQFSFFNRLPDASGNEHEVWFDESTNRWFKATYPNCFGLPWGRDEKTATPLEYLTRLVLQNEFFGDDIQLVAIVRSRQQMRLLTSQPHIAGDPARAVDIQKWFNRLGFVRLEEASRIAWYRKKENLLVADAHEGNIICTPSGELVPIDLNIVQPMGDMLQWALAHCI